MSPEKNWMRLINLLILHNICHLIITIIINIFTIHILIPRH